MEDTVLSVGLTHESHSPFGLPASFCASKGWHNKAFDQDWNSAREKYLLSFSVKTNRNFVPYF